jgi:hypothetical protein
MSDPQTQTQTQTQTYENTGAQYNAGSIPQQHTQSTNGAQQYNSDSSPYKNNNNNTGPHQQQQYNSASSAGQYQSGGSSNQSNNNSGNFASAGHNYAGIYPSSSSINNSPNAANKVGGNYASDNNMNYNNNNNAGTTGSYSTGNYNINYNSNSTSAPSVSNPAAYPIGNLTSSQMANNNGQNEEGRRTNRPDSARATISIPTLQSDNTPPNMKALHTSDRAYNTEIPQQNSSQNTHKSGAGGGLRSVIRLQRKPRPGQIISPGDTVGVGIGFDRLGSGIFEVSALYREYVCTCVSVCVLGT